ncbi:MAG: hypothetical protein U5R31_08745 [Acidimicrobiia bacterium]|nr:hypothetical protein [Acidimicrobiia bacterium]
MDVALAEVRRVLRPGGRFHFLEHGRSPDPKVATWQRRLEPAQKRFADGCHLTREPAELVRDAGFEIERVESRYARGPKPWTWLTEGARDHTRLSNTAGVPAPIMRPCQGSHPTRRFRRPPSPLNG